MDAQCSKDMAITDLPTHERPRERLLTLGAASLTDAELIAILLRVGMRGVSAIEMGRALLERAGGLNGLLQMEASALQRQPGLGQAKSAQLIAALELSRRALAAPLRRGDALSSPAHTRRYLQSELAGERNEVFAALFLDTRHRVIAFEKLFYGTIDGASVHPRVVVQRAMALNAAAIIVAHNHPSGVAEASSQDERITQTLAQALQLVDVRLLDHIIVAGPCTLSFAERGLL